MDISVLTNPEGLTDTASSWLGLLFHGDTAESADASLSNSLISVLQDIMGAYSLTLFTIGAFFLLMQIVSMIAETAHTGVPMGRRVNHVWAPLRLLIGIALLIPAGSGLDVGQRLIVKIAASGSGLATHAWQNVLEELGPQAAQPMPSHLPDIQRLVAIAVENETCRTMYELATNLLNGDEAIQAAGNMSGIKKVEAGQLNSESWFYTNDFFPTHPLCGGYSFLSPVIISEGQTSKSESFVDEAAKASAKQLVYGSFPIAKGIATYALNERGKFEPDFSVKSSMNDLVNEQTQKLYDKQGEALQTWNAQETATLWAKVFEQGWIGAGALPFSFARAQMMFGSLMKNLLPHVTPPLLGYESFTLEDWDHPAQDAFGARGGTSLTTYHSLFYKMKNKMREARFWLYQGQLSNVPSILPSQRAVADFLDNHTDEETAREALTRLAGVGASSFGLFARAETTLQDGQKPQNISSPSTPSAFMARPFQSLSEIGRGYMDYGSWLAGMAGTAFAKKDLTGIALSFYFVALAFMFSGFALLFLVPLAPFFRFIFAVVGWVVHLIGAVLALPLVALAHLYPAGDGMPGPLARQAYWMWLGVFLQPILILLGFVFGLFLFILGMMFLNATLLEWLASMADMHGISFWGVRAGLSVIYVVAAFILSCVAFKGVSLFPHLLTQWINLKNPLPESLVLAPHGIPSQTVMDGHQGILGAPSAYFEKMAQSLSFGQGKMSAKGKNPEASRNANHVLNPQRQEPKAHAHADAQAFAAIHKGEGGDKIVAGVSASASGNDKKAHAISRHIIPDAKQEVNKKTPAAPKLLGVAEQNITKDYAPDKENKAPSRPQETSPLADENSPFASSKEDRHEPE